MPEEVFFALFSLGFLGVSDFLYKWGQRFELRGASFMLFQNMAYIPTAIALAVYRQELDFSIGLGYGFLNGMLAFVAFLLLLKSLKHGDVLALVPVVRLNFAVTAVLTVSFLGEQLNWVKGAALGLAALAILTNGAGYASAARQRKPFFMALMAMILFGCIGLFYKLGLAAGATPGALVVAQSFGALSLALPFAIRSGDNILVRGVHCWLPLLCGALIASSYVAVGIAFSYGDAVVVAPIAQLSFVLTGLLAILFLKEKLHSRKAISIICAILAVLVFSNT